MLTDLLLIGGGIIVGFTLGDVYAYRSRRPPEPRVVRIIDDGKRQLTVAENWDDLRHVRIIGSDDQ